MRFRSSPKASRAAEVLNKLLRDLGLETALALILRDPSSFANVFAMSGDVESSPLAARMTTELLKDQRLQALYAAQWVPASVSLPELLAMPPASLGYQYGSLLRQLGMTPERVQKLQSPCSDSAYVLRRQKETHEIVHVLTGFGVDPLGELSLQAFNLVQNRSPLAVWILLSAAIAVLQRGDALEPLIRAVIAGFQLGLKADLLIGHRLEDHWHADLEALRVRLRLSA